MAANEVRRQKTDCGSPPTRSIATSTMSSLYRILLFLRVLSSLKIKDGLTFCRLKPSFEKIEEMLQCGNGVLLQEIAPDLRIEFYENMLVIDSRTISPSSLALFFGAGDHLHRRGFRTFAQRNNWAAARRWSLLPFPAAWFEILGTMKCAREFRG